MSEEKKWDGDGVPLAESNCVDIGSDADKAARKAAAQTEEAWRGAGAEAGIVFWRIENFKVVLQDKTKFGTFYKGDSYIILHTEKVEEALHHHIYFWLGEKTSADEMGTAAYKTVELDDLLDGEPTQSREVMGNESQQFKMLVQRVCKRVTYLDGGVETGFHHTGADAYQAKLIEVRKTGHGVVIKEVTRARESLNDGDCFVLDAGATIYVWCGEAASPMEKFAANEAAENIEGERLGRAKATHDIDENFWELLGGEGPIKSAAEGSDRIEPPALGDGVLYEIQPADLQMTEIGHGDLHPGMLKSEAVMILDHGAEICIWVGKGAPGVEVRNAFRTVMGFLKANDRNLSVPVHMYKEGTPIKNPVWKGVFAS